MWAAFVPIHFGQRQSDQTLYRKRWLTMRCIGSRNIVLMVLLEGQSGSRLRLDYTLPKTSSTVDLSERSTLYNYSEVSARSNDLVRSLESNSSTTVWRYSIKLDHSQAGRSRRCTIALPILVAAQSRLVPSSSSQPVDLLLLQDISWPPLAGVTVLNTLDPSASPLNPFTGGHFPLGHALLLRVLPLARPALRTVRLGASYAM
jgi:hypothetical protein